MSKTKVMHLTNSIVRGSGPERLILELAEKIDKAEFSMSIVSLSRPTPVALSFLNAAKRTCFQTHYIPWRETKRIVSSILKLCCLIRRWNVHILHTHEPRTNFVGLIAAKITGAKAITSAHGWILFGVPLRIKIYQLIDRFVVIRLFDHILVGSNALRKELCQRNIHRERITAIHYGLDARKFSSCAYDANWVRRKYGLEAHHRLIATVGRLSEEKGHKFLLEAAQIVVKDFPNVRFLIVGEGELRGKLRNYCCKLGLSESVIFTGFCSNVPEVLRGIDIFVLPSLTESFPFAILEAMMAGKPVIATDVGGVAEMIRNRVTGLLIKPSDSLALAESITLLLKNENMAELMGKNAQAMVKTEFTLEHYVRKIQDIYRRIISES